MEREKLSTLGLLVSGVAHDLNNPLASIYGYAQLLLEDEVDPEKRVSLERVILDVRRCNRIVADLLSFARRRAPERGEVDVAELLQRTFELRERQLALAGISAELKVSPGLPPVLGDAHQLQQVFVNILINAEQALRDGGSRIAISAAAGERSPAHDSTWLAIEFLNDGPPIPDGVLGRIFEPFFTTKVAEEGTGLGLSICQRIVNEHGGRIKVESTNAGTAFTVLLPPLAENPSTEEVMPPIATNVL
jgi:two-component system NtrC family sensor kinase